MSGQTNKLDPAYIQSVVAMKTRRDDPREIAITEKIQAYLSSTEWSREASHDVGDMLRSYMREMVAHASEEVYVHDKTQEVLKMVAERLNSTIVEGAEELEKIAKGTPVLLATNHFGAYKLWGLDPKELGVEIDQYDYLAPFPGYFAALYPVAEKLGDQLYYSSNEFPGIFGEIHENAGSIHLPPATTGSRTAYLIDATREKYQRDPHSAVVIFPEGTTSGKPQGGGPFDINPFKTGAYVIAAQLGIHVVPVAQYYDPERGFRLKVFEPYIVKEGDKASYELKAREDQEAIQSWLNQMRNA